VWTGSRMIVWGSSDGQNTGGVYDPTGSGSWTATNLTNAPAGQYVHSAVWTGTRMIVWGGVYTASGTGGSYDPAGSGPWSALSTAGAPAWRYSHTAVWTGSAMVVWGGADSSSANSLNTGGLYDPTTNTWTATPVPGAPAVRRSQTAVWTGRSMIVWGG